MPDDLTRQYLRWALVRSSLARGWWLTTALYLVVEADLTAAQLVLIGVFQGLTVLVAEVPAGVLADTMSRRWTLVAAHVVMGAGMAMTGVVTSYPLLVLTQCLWGLGWALSSGADVAWITDELRRPDLIDRVLTAQGRFELLGTPVGLVTFGGLAWATSLSTAITTAGMAMVVLGLLVVARWPETHRLVGIEGARRTRTAVIFRRGLGLVRADRVFLLVLGGTFLVNGGAQGFGRLFERRLLGLGVPTSPEPIVWFGALALVAASMGAVSLRFVEARIDGAGVARTAYVGACAVGTAGLVLFAHAPNTEWAVAGSLLVTGIAFPTIRVGATVMVNRRTTSEARATVHSLLSQAENLGEVVCGLVLALVAGVASPAVTLTASALLVAAAGLAVQRTRRHESERPPVERCTARPRMPPPQRSGPSSRSAG